MAKDSEAEKNPQHACPNCGYCPHCGRSNRQPPMIPAPYPVPMPYRHPPYFEGPYWSVIAPRSEVGFMSKGNASTAPQFGDAVTYC